MSLADKNKNVILHFSGLRYYDECSAEFTHESGKKYEVTGYKVFDPDTNLREGKMEIASKNELIPLALKIPQYPPNGVL